MRSFIVIATVLALSACAAAPRSGSGTTSTGAPITGDRFTYAGWREDVKFTSVEGWSCEGTTSLKPMLDQGKTSTTFPVQCDNGVKGTVTMALAHPRRDHLRAGDIHYSFRLNNGVMGQFRV